MKTEFSAFSFHNSSFLMFETPEVEIPAWRAITATYSAFLNDDDGTGEALRSDAELEANPSAGLTLQQLDQRIERDIGINLRMQDEAHLDSASRRTNRRSDEASSKSLKYSRGD